MKNKDKSMSFIDHLEELRWRIIKCLFSMVVGGLMTFLFIDFFLDILLQPLLDVDSSEAVNIQVLSVQGMFIIYGTQTSKLRDNYKRFLESQIRKVFKFKGTPIRLIFKDGDNPFAGKKNKLSMRQWKKRRRIIRMRKRKK